MVKLLSVPQKQNKNLKCDNELSFFFQLNFYVCVLIYVRCKKKKKKSFVIALRNMAPVTFPPLAGRSKEDDGWLRRHGRVHHTLRMDHWSAGMLPAA